MRKTSTLAYCPKCEQWKRPDEFNKNVTTADDRSVYCSACHRNYMRDRRARLKAANIAKRQALGN